MGMNLTVEKDIAVPMRDGVTLRADVYRPAQAGPLPVLLQRTPYGKGLSQVSLALLAAERGYCVVIQDTRGRWGSEGANYPMAPEQADGYDTVEWAARQPWSNGQVGMFGASYLGYTQWAAAAAQPPSLRTIIPAFSFSNPYQMVYTGGALSLGVSVAWGLLAVAQMDIVRLPLPPESKAPYWGQLIALVDGMAQGRTFNQLPLEALPLIGKDQLTTSVMDTLLHPTYDELWQRTDCSRRRAALPAYHVGGWYDTFLSSTLSDFAAMQATGQPQKLIIGPWTHANFENTAGEADFGLQASGMMIWPDELMLRWFDYWLKGSPNGVMDEAPVRLFVMGTNQWREEAEWPLGRAQATPFYLHSDGAANSLHGDGRLSRALPAAEPPDTFLYDPADPAPTRGGALLGWQAALPAGAYDQRSIEQRPDVLVYTSDVLEQNLEVTGPLQVQLWVASSAVDTDFTAKLVDVSPDGYARNVQDGILRLRYRDGQDETLLEPGRPYRIRIDLAATSNVFLAGHRLRLEVSSSNFPRFDRNLNTGQPSATHSHFEVARQTVLHDAEHPSFLLLPVVP